jgi:hypothetical protein
VICVDASLAAKWVLPEDYSDQALALFTATAEAGEPIVAPSLLPSEVTNIIRRRMLATVSPSAWPKRQQSCSAFSRFLSALVHPQTSTNGRSPWLPPTSCQLPMMPTTWPSARFTPAHCGQMTSDCSSCWAADFRRLPGLATTPDKRSPAGPHEASDSALSLQYGGKKKGWSSRCRAWEDVPS